MWQPPARYGHLMETSVYHSGHCSFCDQGRLCFYLCGDGETVILLCDECDTAWLSPAAVDGGEPDTPGEWPEFRLGKFGVALAGGRFARRDEIRKLGWEPNIEGEYIVHLDKFGHVIPAEKAEAERRKKLRRLLAASEGRQTSCRYGVLPIDD